MPKHNRLECHVLHAHLNERSIANRIEMPGHDAFDCRNDAVPFNHLPGSRGMELLALSRSDSFVRINGLQRLSFSCVDRAVGFRPQLDCSTSGFFRPFRRMGFDIECELLTALSGFELGNCFVHVAGPPVSILTDMSPYAPIRNVDCFCMP